MKTYITFNIVNKIKFYRTNENEWSSNKQNLKIFLEDETEDFLIRESQNLTKLPLYDDFNTNKRNYEIRKHINR